MAVNSIKKGKGFEREVANFLTRITDAKWNRVPCSGGFQTSHNTTNPVFSGDVFTEDERYKDIVIECKFHKYLVINDFFNHESKLYDWIRQSIKESQNNNWILFFKINNIGTFIISQEYFEIPFWQQIQKYQKSKIHINLWYEPSNTSYTCFSLQNLAKK